MSKSIARVEQAAHDAGMAIEIRRMGESTRTAAEAAEQCGCAVAQIVKSLIFLGKDSGRLYLFLVAGDRQLDLAKAAALAGEALGRADPRQIRDETASRSVFAVGTNFRASPTGACSRRFGRPPYDACSRPRSVGAGGRHDISA